jgi:hypothetical protein
MYASGNRAGHLAEEAVEKLVDFFATSDRAPVRRYPDGVRSCMGPGALPSSG